ncbi:MAG TPA: LysR substrate-binding domain-containing protein [Bradyrhizobium sp.]
MDWLLRGELDVMMSYDPQPMKSVRIVPVMFETLQLIAPGSDELHSDEPLHFAQLADRKLIMPSPRHGLRAILDDCARQAGIKLRASIEVESFGVTILPPAPVHAQIASRALRAVPLIDPSPDRKLALIYPSERPVSPAARFVGEAFAGIAADLVEERIWLGELL